MNEQGYTSDSDKSDIMPADFQDRDFSDNSSNDTDDMMEAKDNISEEEIRNQIKTQRKENNISVLNEIYQNSIMGKQSISNIIPKIEDENFKKELLKNYEDYEEMCSISSSEIMKAGDKPREKNPLSKAMLWGTINVTSIVDSSSSNLASLIIKGSHNSVTNLTRALNQFSQKIDENVKELADSYIKNEEENIESLKKFL